MATKQLAEAITIEEALRRTHFGLFHYLLICFTALVLNNVVLESVAISFALPIIKCDLNLTERQTGILGAVGFSGIIISSYMWGYLADTIGRKRIMQSALIVAFVLTVFSSLMPSYELLVAFRFINGIFVSASSATVFAYLGEFHCAQHRNLALLLAAILCGSLAILMPFLAMLVVNLDIVLPVPFLHINFNAWRLFMIVCGIPGFICGILLFLLPESPKFLLRMSRFAETIEVLEQVHRCNRRHKEEQLNVTALLPEENVVSLSSNHLSKQKKNIAVTLLISLRQQTAPLFQEHLRKTLLCSLIQFILFFSTHGVFMWFPYMANLAGQYEKLDEPPRCLCDILVYFHQQQELQEETTNTLNTNAQHCQPKMDVSTFKNAMILEVIYVFLLVIITFAIKKCGRKLILFVTLCGTGIIGAVGFYTENSTFAIYCFLIYMCCSAGVPVMNAIVVDIYPTHLRGMAICISLMLGRMGSVIGSSVLGALIVTHCQIALACASLSLIIAALLGFLLPRSQSATKPEVT